MIPASTHRISSNSAEPSCAAMMPGLRNMPDPMTPPATTVMVVNRPRVGTSVPRFGDGSWGVSLSLMDSERGGASVAEESFDGRKNNFEFPGGGWKDARMKIEALHVGLKV